MPNKNHHLSIYVCDFFAYWGITFFSNAWSITLDASMLNHCTTEAAYTILYSGSILPYEDQIILLKFDLSILERVIALLT
jgi:hypothetical protein